MKCPADHGNKSELTCFEGKQEKIHGIYELLQQLLKGRPPNKYYLSSRNPETQKPFCTVWLPWPLDQCGKWPTASSPHQSSPSLLMNGTSNTEPTVLATVKQTGKWNQQLKQQRTSTGKPWIPERTRTLRYSTTATHRPKEWSLVRYSA